MTLLQRSRPHRRWTTLTLGLALYAMPAAAAALAPAPTPPITTTGSAAAGAAAGPAGVCEPDAHVPRAEGLVPAEPLPIDPARLAERVAGELAIASAPATWLARGLALEAGLRRQGGRPAAAALREVEADYINALKFAPDAEETAAQLRSFYSRWIVDLPAPGRDLLGLVAGSRDPEALALRLAPLHVYSGDPVSTDILLAALTARPHASRLWACAARFVEARSWKLAFLAEARRDAPAGGADPAGMETAGPIAVSRLTELFDHGLAPEMLSTFRALPAPLRARIAGGAWPAGSSIHDPEAASAAGGQDLRLQLAAAHLLTGDPAGAREWAARAATAASAAPGAAPPPASPGAAPEADLPAQDPDEARARRQAERTRQVVESWIAPSAGDPFPLLSGWVTDAGMGGGTPADGWELFAARFALRESYPGFGAHLLADVAGSLQRAAAGERWQPPVPVPPRVRQDAERLAAAFSALRSELDAQISAAHDARQALLGPDPAAAAIARLLAAPPRIVFAARPLPDGLEPLPAAAASPNLPSAADAAGAPRPLEPPPGFTAVRAERQGDQAAAIGTSQDYDPVGELSGGAYWVVLSEDGGKTWERPLYTGLRVNQPYVVVARSALPLLAGDRLQVEVEVRELDPEAITFPPVMLKPKRVAKGLYLEIPVALLRQDSDGDGLTDLAEERLLTDPDDPDTDHDGLPDGIDPLPHVARRADGSPRTRALAALLAELPGMAKHAIVEGVKDPAAGCCGQAAPPSLGREQTLFIVGDRALFAGIEPRGRIVILTPDEQALAARKFGPFYPAKIELFELDRAGRSALAVWSSGWQGGTIRLEERDGTFTVVDGQVWIT